MWKSEDTNSLTTSHHHYHPVHHHFSSATSMSQMPTIIGSTGSSNSDSTPNTTTGHSLGRKRRGMIEKRRRDRINNSLNELRRLVPAAFEKQGSAKLEKAEILQMTVDHLTMLHAKGFDAFSFDPHKFAMDYHAIGFRECASEVARYMVTVEGLDLQDPLRLRLMAHLQCYAAQREMSLKSSASVTSWNPSAFTTPSHHMSASSSSTSSAMMSASSMGPPPPPPSLDPVNNDHWSTTIHANHGHHHHHSHQGINGSSSEIPVTSSPSVTSLSNGQSYFTYPGSSVKHYRPWGGELAY